MNCFRKSFHVAIVALIASLVTGCNKSSETGTTGILVSTDWLQEHLHDPDLVVLHAGTAELFDSIHIPGARLITPASFTISTDSLRNELPPKDSIEILLREAGINKESRILLYHETSRLLTRTARIFVTLDHVGLGGQTFLLDGGFPAWQEEQRECSGEASEFSYGNLDLVDTKKVVIGASELDRQRWNEEIVILDVRSDEEYYGTPGTEDAPAEGGHIEGAYFLPYQAKLMDERTHYFRSAPELRKIFKKAGVDPEKISVIYCGSGIRASVSYVAAVHLGYPVLLYDGSYEEWTRLGLPLTGPVAIPDTLE